MPPTLTVPDLEPAGPPSPARIDQSGEVPIEMSIAATPRSKTGRACVVATFNRPIDWIQWDPRTARQVAEMLRKASYEAER